MKKDADYLPLTFGTTYLYEPGFHGFKHFGQADFGAILLVGGIWFLLSMLILYYKVFIVLIFRDNEKKDNKTAKILILITLIIVSVYTQCFTRANLMLDLMLLMLAFRLAYIGGNKNYENGNNDIY